MRETMATYRGSSDWPPAAEEAAPATAAMSSLTPDGGGGTDMEAEAEADIAAAAAAAAAAWPSEGVDAGGAACSGGMMGGRMLLLLRGWGGTSEEDGALRLRGLRGLRWADSGRAGFRKFCCSGGGVTRGWKACGMLVDMARLVMRRV